MNRKTLIKTLALSSLLVSAVAVPTVSNASSANEEKGSIAAAIMQPAASVGSIQVDPLELVKTYAPDTLKEWEETLAKYEEVVGGEATAVVPATESTPAEMAGSDEEMKPEPVKATEPVASTEATRISGQANNTDSAFVNLYEAAESKDAAAIKKALNDLLQQYKQLIADYEKANE